MYDLIVIGAGSGGLAAAKKAAKAGLSVCLIEEDRVGGTCVSYGCVPKKLWHAVSKTALTLATASDHGFETQSSPFDWPTVQQKISDVVVRLNNSHQSTCESLGITLIKGTASLASETSVLVNNQEHRGKRILLATGATAHTLPIPGAHFCDTSQSFFSWSTLPTNVVIWGGGYIAVELGGILNALGCKVHIIIRKEHVLTGFDSDFQTELHQRYLASGMVIHSETSISSIQSSGQQLQVECENGLVIDADRVIQALGRSPNTAELNCQAIGIECASNGRIVVNEDYQTSVPSIYAIGDCSNAVQLTPVAIAEGREWVSKVLLKQSFDVDYTVVPTAIFSHPEAATVGVTEADARHEYNNVSTKILRFNPLTSALNQAKKDAVWIKLIFQGEKERLIGVHMVCDNASEIIQCLAIAIQNGVCKQDLDTTMALHPSISEELVTIY